MRIARASTMRTEYERSLAFDTRIGGRRNMARRPLTKPRKTPRRSDRARPSTRWSRRPLAFWSRKASTRPAPTASPKWPGVSVGSLYQYFPSKEALVAAVIERHQQEIMQMVRGELAEVDALSRWRRRCAGWSPSRSRRTRRSQAASRARRADPAHGRARETSKTFNRRELRALPGLSREPQRGTSRCGPRSSPHSCA